MCIFISYIYQMILFEDIQQISEKTTYLSIESRKEYDFGKIRFWERRERL